MLLHVCVALRGLPITHRSLGTTLWVSIVSSAFSGTFQLAFLGIYLEREYWGRAIVIPG